MITIGTQTSSVYQLSTPSVGEKKAGDETLEASPSKTLGTGTEGVKVSLSDAGLQKAADDRRSNPNSDIEESGLPDQAQKLLKMIRELKQKIEEKQQEMQAVMADQNMSPEVKQAKVGTLQSELGTLTANLMTASNSLDKFSKNGTLSAAQAQQATQLAMKK